MVDPLSVLAELTRFGRTLTGALRRETVAERTAECLERLFDPAAIAVSVGAGDATPGLTLAVASGSPTPTLQDPFLAELLAAAPHVIRVTGPARLGAPLVAAGHTMGIIGVWGKDDVAFKEDDEAVIAAVAAGAALALQNAQLITLLSTGKRDWEQMVDAMGPAICIVGARGGVRRANRAFADLVAAPITTLAGRPWLTLLPPAWAEPIGKAIAAPGGAGGEIRTDRHIYSVNAQAIQGDEPGTVVLLIVDTTETRRLQEQLIQSEKLSAIGQLIAGVAHELNNPLASVLGFADFLTEAADVPANLREPLRVIQEEAQRAAGIVKNLLTFARKQDQERRSLSVGPILERTLALLKNQLIGLKVEPLLVVEPGLPDIDGSANQLQQVLVNVVNNAAQAIASTGRPGTVVVRARPWLDGIAIDVVDNGPGIPEEVQNRVFEPFFTTKAEGEGTGLGLSICQGIVKEHGGKITLKSAPGHGATFTIELPPAGAPDDRAALPAQGVVAGGRVLVVDDEPQILHFMRATLEAWGYTVETAADGQEALGRVLGEHFDLIITDVRMPLLTGRELFERLRHDAPEMAKRIVFATGDTVRDDTMAFLAGSGRPCLHKPYKLAELKHVLSTALETPA
ncbi:MAG: ATP-binding protein [Gemmatimonadales bacterium]|nr:ATP-binding protein [Gemmatimonadales bacterium]